MTNKSLIVKRFLSRGIFIVMLMFFGAISVNAQTATSTNLIGCTSTSGYSTTTGQLCNGNGGVSGSMSTTTNTSTTGAFPTGCSSYNGFSPTTGESCMSLLFTTTVSTPIATPISFPVSIFANVPLCEIQRSLKIGSTGLDVRCLQRFLNYSGYTVSTSGAGSVGNESTYFGPATANAVTRWQNANASQVLIPSGLSLGTGIFGSASFNYYVALVINALRASMSTTTP